MAGTLNAFLCALATAVTVGCVTKPAPPPTQQVVVEVTPGLRACSKSELPAPVCLTISNRSASALRFEGWNRDGTIELFPHFVQVEVPDGSGGWRSTDVTSLSEYLAPTHRLALPVWRVPPVSSLPCNSTPSCRACRPRC